MAKHIVESRVKKRVRTLLEGLKEDFPEFEIEQVVADLELRVRGPFRFLGAKGMIQVTMRKRGA